MKNPLRLLPLLAVLAPAAFPAPSPAPVPADFIANIEKAMPAAVPAKPARERRILVFWLSRGMAHPSIGTANQVFEIMGRKTGAFTADFSDKMEVFTPENLARYDAVVFNNTTQLNFEEPGTRDALMNFVKGGKGIVGVHAATDCFYGWPEAAEMMGGLFENHPWGSGGTWRIRVTEPDHPLNAAFKGADTFLLKDEIYQFRGPFRRTDRRMLVELDRAAPENQKVNGAKQGDWVGISWIKKVGQGRLFYCSLGHNHEVFWNPAVLAHYLAGTQYALGDLKAVDDPLPAVAPKGVSVLRDWKPGMDNSAFAGLEEEIGKVDDAVLAALETALVEIAADAKATDDGRDEALRLIARMATAKSVPVLQSLLGHARLGSRAMWALDRNPAPEATLALRKALAEGPEAVKISAAVALANRGDTESVPALAKCGADTSGALALAAIHALGRLGAPAVDALAALKVPEALRTEQEEALAFAAGQAGNIPALRTLLAGAATPAVRAACITALARAGDGESLVKALADSDKLAWQAGLAAVRSLPDSAVSALTASIASLPRERLPAILQAITDSGKAGLAPVALKWIRDTDPALADAAIRAVAALDAPGNLSELLALSAGEGAPAKAATAALAATRSDIATPLLPLLAGLPSAQQSVALSLLADRGDRAAIPVLLKAAVDPANDPFRKSAADALARIGGQEEYGMLVNTVASTPSLRARLIPALRAFGARVPDAAAAAAAVSKAMSAGLPAQEGCMLLGSLKSEEAALKLIELAASPDPQTARLAVRELGAMTSPAVVRRLVDMARAAADATVRTLAFRAAARALPAAEMPDAEKQTLLESLYAAAAGAEDRKAALACVPAIDHPGVLNLLGKASADPELKAEYDLASTAVAGRKWPVVEVAGPAVFPAKTAVIRGPGASYEPAANRDCIGVWDNPSAWVFWAAKAVKPGKYRVSVEHSCMGVAGADVQIVVAGKVLPFKVTDTGAWDQFPSTVVGEVELAAGMYSVEVRPLNKPKPFVMNLRSVKLTPAE